jgi:PAS domain S-box-containing protein
MLREETRRRHRLEQALRAKDQIEADEAARIRTLTEERDQLDRLLDQLIQIYPGAFCYLDRSLIYRRVNPTYARLFGRSVADFLGRPLFEVFHGTEDQIEGPLRQVLTTGLPFHARRFPFTYTDAQGAHASFWDLDIQAQKAKNGSVMGLLVLGFEVSEQLHLEAELAKREEALRQREALFAAFMDHSPSASHMRDATGRIVYVSRNFETLFGISPEEAIGTVQPPWTTDEDWQQIQENEQRVLAENRSLSFEEPITLPDGQKKLWLSMKFPFQLPNGQRYLGSTLLDITDMKRQERELRESNRELERLRRLQRREFEFMVQNVEEYAIYMLDPQGRVMTWNAGAEAISGYSEGEILGQSNAFFHLPEDVAAGKPESLLERAIAEGSVEDDGWRVRKNGERFWAHTALTAVLDQGKLVGFVKVVRDMTEPRRIEAISRELAALGKLDRMKDDFLAVISHELRTPLNFITGFASILDDEVAGPLNETQQSYVKKILNGADRMLFHVNNLVEMSRLSAGKLSIQPSATAYPTLVAHVLHSLLPLAEDKRIRLEADLQVSGEVLLDGQRITQVISNLLDNAIKFTPEGGRITIRAYAQEDRLVTEITDTGIGIAEEDLPKIFRRFVQLDMTSTRSVGGTGLGLSICKSIVEAHGGSIGARSEGPGKGSTFWFSLPLAREEG